MSIPSRRLERPPAAPAAHGSSLVNAEKLAFARTRLRGVALRYLAFAFVLVERIGIAPIRRSACKANPGSEPAPRGFRVAYGNDSFDSHSLAAFIDNFTVGTAGWT